eukprot:TRINITY_DN38319_c1_g1_i1.p3 TRINITY_DN38319_c1_g1~~TRINITY_DN38319_c1_g1_i1.p3  ORF type:complete len:167 (-),score=36.07 TRINITY_DN38319_c1_g1_i1:165-665(-)
MALATVDAEGRPSLRTVLMKGHDRSGFVFYTNCHSRKGRELADNRNVALLFHWKSLRRQIRIEGSVHPVEGETADRYFHSRPRDSQIGAVVSRQSDELSSRATLFDEFAAARDRFEGEVVPRPAHWSGYRVEATAIEAWLDRPHRLHERKLFAFQDGVWRSTWLYP